MQLTSKLEAASKEVGLQRQELWTLEKQRADLASELERYKQDNEFMEVGWSQEHALLRAHKQALPLPQENSGRRIATLTCSTERQAPPLTYSTIFTPATVPHLMPQQPSDRWSSNSGDCVDPTPLHVCPRTIWNRRVRSARCVQA